jgi:hypothetical protein
MARNELKAKIRLEGDASGADKAVKKTEGGLRRLTSFLKKNMLAVTAAVAAGFFALSKAFGSVTSAAQEQEDAVRALDAALIPLGDNAGKVSKALQEQAAALQKVTKFGDETIIRGQALIASFTKNEEEIKGATQAALDLSAAVGVDLNAAFLLMGKAAAGETSTLTRYGIILDEGLSKSEKFAAAIATVNEQFGGRAAEAAKTYSGVIQQIGNAYGDLKERLGEAIIKNKEVLSSLTSLRDLLTSGGLVDAISSFASFIAEATSATIDFAVALKNISVGTAAAVSGIGDWTKALERSVPFLEKQILGLKQIADAYLNLPRALTALGSALSDQEEAQRLAAEAADELASRQRDAAIATGELVLPFEELTKLVVEYAKESGKTDTETKNLVKNFRSMAIAIGDASTAYATLIGNQERANRIQRESAEALKAFGEEAARLGIVLEKDVAAEIEKNNVALAEAERLWKSGEISALSYRNAQEKIAEANRNLRESLTGVSEETANSRDEIEGLSGALSGATERTNGLTRANAGLAQSFTDVGNAANVTGAAFSGQKPLIPGGGPSGGTFTVVGKNIKQLPNGRIVVA